MEDRTSSRSYGPISSRSRASNSSEGTSCLGDECSLGGDAFCALTETACRTSPALPCIECVAGSSASSRSRSSRDNQCTEDKDCPEGYCEKGTCRPGCKTTEDCKTGVCVYGSCVPCFEDFECPGNRCENGKCLPCAHTLDCPSGFICEAGICTAPSNMFCDSNADCSSGELCLNGLCLPETTPSCREDGDCSPSERCIQGYCLSRELLSALPDFCGNARIDPGESCDEGSGNSDLPNALCRTDCTVGRCGDGILDTPLELCDDGNNLPKDGCSVQCQMERSAPIAEETLPGSIIELPFLPPAQSTYTLPPSTVAPQSPAPPGNTDTGPAAIFVMISGAAAGWAWMRKRN